MSTVKLFTDLPTYQAELPDYLDVEVDKRQGYCPSPEAQVSPTFISIAEVVLS